MVVMDTSNIVITETGLAFVQTRSIKKVDFSTLIDMMVDYEVALVRLARQLGVDIRVSGMFARGLGRVLFALVVLRGQQLGRLLFHFRSFLLFLLLFLFMVGIIHEFHEPSFLVLLFILVFFVFLDY